MLGITYKLRVALETKVSPTKEEGKAFMDDFLDVTNIVRKSYMGQQSLEGNQTKKFLKSLERLQTTYMECRMLAAALPYIHVLESFAKVVEDCFGMGLQPNYEDNIAKFSALYRQLPLSITP